MKEENEKRKQNSDQFIVTMNQKKQANESWDHLLKLMSANAQIILINLQRIAEIEKALNQATASPPASPPASPVSGFQSKIIKIFSKRPILSSFIIIFCINLDNLKQT